MPPLGSNIFQGKNRGIGSDRENQDKESLQRVKGIYSLKFQAILLDFFV